MVENSTGIPPASPTPRLTESASPLKCKWQWTRSDQGLQMPTTGRPSAVAAAREARWMNPARSRPANQRALRRESGIVRIYVTGVVPSAVAAALAGDFEVVD